MPSSRWTFDRETVLCRSINWLRIAHTMYLCGLLLRATVAHEYLKALGIPRNLTNFEERMRLYISEVSSLSNLAFKGPLSPHTHKESVHAREEQKFFRKGYYVFLFVEFFTLVKTIGLRPREALACVCVRRSTRHSLTHASLFCRFY